jgi:WD40 repeat protein
VAEGQLKHSIAGAVFDRTGRSLLTIVDPGSSTDPAGAVWNIGEPSDTAPSAPRTLDGPTTIRSADVDAEGFFVDDRTLVMMTKPDATRAGRVRLSDARSGFPLAAPLQVAAAAIRVNRSGRRIAVTGGDGKVGVWTVRSPLPTIDLPTGDTMLQARFSRDGTHVLTASFDRTAAVWDIATRQVVGRLDASMPLLSAEYSRDEALVLANSGGAVKIWDAHSGALRVTITATDGDFFSARLNADATAVVTASKAAPARIWDARTGRLIREFPDAQGLWSAEFSPDGTRLVTASRDAHADVWVVASGAHVGRPLVHKEAVVEARFSADGSRVVTASIDGTAKVWSGDANTLVADLKHFYGVNSAQFVAGSNTEVVTTSNDWTARIWTVDGAKPRAIVLPHDAPVDAAQIDAGARRLLTVGTLARTVRVWDLATGQPLTRTIALPGAVWFAQLSPNGQRIVTAGGDGVARLVSVPSGSAADAQEWLAPVAEAIGGYTIDELGALVEVADRGRRLQTFRMEAAAAPEDSFRTRFMRWFFLDAAGIL